MKLIIIWDIHWLNVWKKLIEESNNPDKVIFLWDYVDSFLVPDRDIINNLKDIIEYKKANPQKVELLLWNHDVQYIYPWNGCSWRRPRIAWELKRIYEENLDLFKIAHQEWKYIFSHAWFNILWRVDNTFIIDKWKSEPWEDDIITINNILKTSDKNILFQCWRDRWWFDKNSWPLWADKSITLKYGKVPWKIQVVWHTAVSKIENYWHIIFCDNLERWDWKPLILNI